LKNKSVAEEGVRGENMKVLNRNARQRMGGRKELKRKEETVHKIVCKGKETRAKTCRKRFKSDDASSEKEGDTFCLCDRKHVPEIKTGFTVQNAQCGRTGTMHE
jgi:hypothetical protein